MTDSSAAMSPDERRERFRRASELFAEALDRDVERRPAFLEERCGGDDELLKEVLELLGAHETAGSCSRSCGRTYRPC